MHTQDCMGGTIDNNIIALIMSEDKVPEIWQEMVRRTYPEYIWEKGEGSLGR